MGEIKIGMDILIGVLGGVVSVATFIIGRLTAAKNSGKEAGTILTEVGYIKANTDEIKSEQKEQRKTSNELCVRITAVEESTKSAHKRIDTLEERVK